MGKTGGYLLQQWIIKCKDNCNSGKEQHLLEQQKQNRQIQIQDQRAYSPLGYGFKNIKTTCNNFGQKLLVNFEGTDIIQFSNITFYFNNFFAGCNKLMRFFRVQIFSTNSQWLSIYINDENTNYTTT